MANQEHLEILRQGVQEWNQWRKNNPEISVDLSSANLSLAAFSGADLSDADLSDADLRGADLRGTILSGAILRGTNLSWAILREANLSMASLLDADFNGANFSGVDLRKVNLSGRDFAGKDFSGANLSESRLCGTNLSEANLSGADLSNTDLSNAKLMGVNLFGTILIGTILIGADLSNAKLNNTDLSWAVLSNAKLSGADLSNAKLNGTDLSNADLSNADLSNADLSNADLSNADLSNTDLSGRIFTEKDLTGVDFQNTNLQTARLINAKLDGANLTGARLWEIQRAGWSIKGVICESVYWDKEAEKISLYAEDEFEKLFTDLAKIQLSYKGGINLLEIATLPALIQHLANTFPDCSLRFVDIHEDAGGKVVELAIEDVSKEQIKQLQEALEKEAQQQVELQRKALKQRKKRLELEGEVKQLSRVVDKMIQRPTFTYQPKGDIYLSDERSDIINISGGQVGAVGRNATAQGNTFNQHFHNTGEPLDLVALATELAQLRIAIAAKQDASPQAMIAGGEIAKAEIAAGDKDESKIYEHLKAAGQWALDTATQNGTSVAADVIKKSMGMP